MHYGLGHRIKYARLVQRKASSPKAQGADQQGYRYFVQLTLEGVPYQKPKHTVGKDIIGADLGPSTVALVPQQAEARLLAAWEVIVQLANFLADRAPKLWRAQSRSLSAKKFEPTYTRASFSPETREAGSVEGRLGTPAALARGALSQSAQRRYVTRSIQQCQGNEISCDGFLQTR